MSDNTTLNPGAGGDVVAADDVGGVKYQVVKLNLGGDGVSMPVSGTVPVSGTIALDAPSLAALENVVVSGTVDTGLVQPLTDTQLRASAVPVSGTFYQATQPVSGTVSATQSGNWSIRNQDGTGIAITSIADGAGQTGLTTAIGATNFVVSAANSSVAQLAAAATFTGTIETIFNQQAISVLLTTDQTGTLTLNQYIDAGGTRNISSWAFPIVAGVPFSRSFVGNGNFFNLVFQNTGGSTTTTLRIDTAYGTLPGATNLGNQPVSLNEVSGTALTLGQKAMNASLPVVIASDQAAVAVNQAGTSATGNVTALNSNLATGVATANSAVALSLTGATGFSLDIRGTFVATVLVQGTVNGTDWITLSVLPIGAGLNIAQVASATAVGAWWGNANGLQQVRATASAYTSGTVTVVLRAMQAAGMVYNLPAGQTTQPVSGTVTATANVTGYPTAAASADALANPTVTKVDSTGLVFNGTTWDRVRGMSTALTTGDTGAKVATGNGATITNVGNKGIQILVNMGVVSGTTPTAVFKVQGSTDAGATWYDIPGATTASIVATGQYGVTIYPGIAVTAGVATTGTTATANMVIPRTWRMVWTIGGTTPSFTITAVQYIYLPN